MLRQPELRKRYVALPFGIEQEDTANFGPNTEQDEIERRLRELDEDSRRSIEISIQLSLFAVVLSIVWSILSNRIESESIPSYVCWIITNISAILFATSTVIEFCNRQRKSLTQEIKLSFLRTRQCAMKIIAFASGLNAIGVGTSVLVDQIKSGVPILVFRLVLFFYLFGLTFYSFWLFLKYSIQTDDIIIR
ncbi:MAG: hypothetical protein MHMPM18_002647 [Marteilia pararefringens]